MLRIRFAELPLRAKSLLDAAELSKVFGGCKTSGYCKDGCDDVCACYKCTFGVVSKAC